MRLTTALLSEKNQLLANTPSNGIYFLESDVMIRALTNCMVVYTQVVKTLSVFGSWEDISSEMVFDDNNQLVTKLASPVESHALNAEEAILIPAGTAFMAFAPTPCSYSTTYLPISGLEITLSSPKPMSVPFDIIADMPQNPTDLPTGEMPTPTATPIDISIENTAPATSNFEVVPPQSQNTSIRPKQEPLRSYDYIGDLHTRETQSFYADESSRSLRFGIYCFLPFLTLTVASILLPELATFAFVITVPIACFLALRLRKLMTIKAPTLEISKRGLLFYTESYDHLFVPWDDLASLSIEPDGRNDICLVIRVNNRGNYLDSLEPVRKFIATRILKDSVLSEQLVLKFNKSHFSDSVENVKFEIMKAQHHSDENNSQNIL